MKNERLRNLLLGVSISKKYSFDLDLNLNIDDIKLYEDEIRWHGLEDYFIEYCLGYGEQFAQADIYKEMKNKFLERRVIVQYKLRELSRLVSLLEGKNIDFAIIKGFSTVYWMNEEYINAKASADFDLLVRESQLEEAREILIGDGYLQSESMEKCMLRRHLVWHLSPLEKGLNYIELHHKFTQICDKHIFNVEEALNNKVYAKIGNVTFPVLNLEDTIYLLALHLYQHEFKDITFQLKRHAEIVNIILNHGKEINWNKFISKIKKCNAEFPVSYSFYHINLIYEKVLKFNCIPDEVLAEIMPEDFYAKKDMLTHRHMYNDEPLGEWDYETDHWRFKYGKEWEPGYESRLFGNMKDVTLRYYYLFFRHFANMNLKRECEKIGIEYTDNIFF